MEDLLLLQYTPFTMVAVHSNKSQWKRKESNLKIEIKLIHPTKKGKKQKQSNPSPRKEKSWYHL